MSDLTSAIEIVEKVKQDRYERIEKTPFEKCVNIREAGVIYRDAASTEEAISILQTDHDLDEQEAERRIKRYITVFTKHPSVAHWGEFFGSRFFTEQSVGELASDSRYSEGEIRRWIRDYVGYYQEEIELTDVSIPEDPPDISDIHENHIEEITEAATTLQDIDIDDLMESVEEIDSSDFEFKWMDFLVGGVREDLYTIYQEEGEEEVISILSGLLSNEESCEAILDQVDSRYLQEEREEIIKQAIDAHNNGNYALSVPAALTQIDGAIIEAATELGVWEIDDDVTGTNIVNSGEGSPQHISEFREPFREFYPRLMGRGTPRAKILHGIRTNFVHDENFSTKMIWMALKSFSVADNIHSTMHIRNEEFLKYLSVSSPKNVENIANRFQTNEAHVSTLCEGLNDDGYLTQIEGEKYTTTEEGEERLSELRGF
jgi:hypothetical protein